MRRGSDRNTTAFPVKEDSEAHLKARRLLKEKEIAAAYLVPGFTKSRTAGHEHAAASAARPGLSSKTMTTTATSRASTSKVANGTQGIARSLGETSDFRVRHAKTSGFSFGSNDIGRVPRDAATKRKPWVY
eukprot:TRINITY_DN5298_c0_g1_i1.p1 TRINITY_DN5298_c0_g1~~TRINITY_DN5298_c0_g1_i1.p1  ORF type:complete len:131 (+),score=1.35 TRINITY_DN5298_c0_g1_i1:143-535(+)